jgi:hypothetical protein
MSRRKVQWKRQVRQAGGIDKVLPVQTKGAGVWLTKVDFELPNRPSEGTGRGKTCTLPISSRKEQLVRQWTK